MSSSTSAKRKLRGNDLEIDIKFIGTIAFQITGSKLPSKRQVLQVMFYHMRYAKLSKRESARLVVREALIFWEKARIPTQFEQECTLKLERLYDKWDKLKKVGNKTYAKHEKNVEGFSGDLDNLFDIAHSAAMEMMSIEEDKQFLVKQREKGRIGSMLGIDNILAAKEKRKSDRMEQEQRRKQIYVESEHQRGKCQLSDQMVNEN